MALLALENVSVAYDNQYILQNFNLNIEKGQLISLLGPSGCGKTTTLRLIAGFLEAKDGRFLFDGKDYTRVRSTSATSALCSKATRCFRTCLCSITWRLDSGCAR